MNDIRYKILTVKGAQESLSTTLRIIEISRSYFQVDFKIKLRIETILAQMCCYNKQAYMLD